MKIEQSVIDEIIAQARKEAPDESCGYLLGKNDTDGDGVVTENYPMENVDHSPEHSHRRDCLCYPQCRYSFLDGGCGGNDRDDRKTEGHRKSENFGTGVIQSWI